MPKNLDGERVRFVYLGEEAEIEKKVKALTMADAKAGLAATFRMPVDSIEIVIRG